MVTTRSAAIAKMEEQLTLLLAKMEEQSQQLQLLTRQQSQRVDEVAKKQEETREQVHAIAGDLESVKTTVQGQLGEVEEAVSSVKTLQTELGERQKSLKAEPHDELLRELSEAVGKTGLRPTAPPFIPAETASSETVVATGKSSSGTDGGLGDGRETVDDGPGGDRSTSQVLLEGVQLVPRCRGQLLLMAREHGTHIVPNLRCWLESTSGTTWTKQPT